MLPPEVIQFLKSYKWIIIILFFSLLVGYSSVIFLGKNNPIELEIEKVIEVETGVHVDLTP
jgi:hypothetical protein